MLVFSLTLACAVSAADDTTSEELITTNTSINDSQLTDPYVVESGESFFGPNAIQNAINSPNTLNGYHIQIEAGTYFEQLTITKSLTLIGMGASPTDTIIDGSGTGTVIYIPAGVTVTLINLTIQNGHASDGTILHPDGYDGGGIWNEGTLYLTSCVLRDNQAGDGGSLTYGGIGGDGGAIYNTGSATITDCEIYDNRAGDGTDGFFSLHSNGFNGGHGGAIYSTGTLTITNSEMYNNRAGNGGDGVVLGDGGNGGSGGAIFSTGTLDISDTLIHDNLAGNAGAGGTQVIIGGTGGTGGDGGAIYNTGTATITNSEINFNTAGNGGSGADGGDGSLVLLHPDGYAGHTGGNGGNGGAIYNTGNLEISASQISNNTAGNGGNGGNGGNAVESTQPNTGGTGGNGGAGGNSGGIFNSNYLLLTESTVTSNRSGNGGTGGNGGKGSDQWRYWWIYHWVYVNSGNGGNGGNGGVSGSGAGIYHNGTYLIVTSNNLTNNIIGTPGNGGAGGLKGTGTGGTNGIPGNAGSSGIGGAVYLRTNLALPQINYNRILNNTLPDIASYNGINVNAENNWWGTNFEGSSPSLAGRVSSGVDADPWVMLRLIVPNPIYNGVPVQFIGDLTQNSDSNPVGGYIPNDVQTDFTATRGTVDTPEYTLNGQATTTFSPTSSGAATFTVTVDYQTVTVNQNVEPRAVLDFTKSVSNNHPNYGDIIHFIITVQNTGPDTATDVNVTDLLPAGLVYQSHTLNAGTYDYTTGLWSIGSLTVPTGGVYLDIVALVNATGFFNNTATLAQSTYPQDEVNRSATLNVDPAAILIVTKTGNGSVNVGNTANYTITVTNNGPNTAHNLVAHDFFDTDTEVTIPILSELAPSASYTFGYGSLTNSSHAGRNIPNSVYITCDEYPGQSNTATGYVFVQMANITLNKTDNTTNHRANVGDLVNFTITAHNNGPSNATNVVITDVLPIGLDFVSASDGGLYDDATRTITWAAFNLDFGAPDMFRTFVARVNATMAGVTGGIINTAHATFTEYPFTASGTNTAIYVPLADLYINSWASKNNPYVGEIITITFKVGNRGPDTAQNVVFTLTIPEGMDFVDVTVDQGPTPIYDPVTRTLTWILGDVVVGDPTALVRVKVLRAGIFVFAPSLSTDTYDPNLESNIQTVTVNAQTVPKPSSKTVGMQTTGSPIAKLVLAVLMVLGGLLLPKRIK